MARYAWVIERKVRGGAWLHFISMRNRQCINDTLKRFRQGNWYDSTEYRVVKYIPDPSADEEK